MRLLVEIREEIRGDSFPVGVPLSGDDYVPGGITLDDTRETSVLLQELAPVEYVSLTTGCGATTSRTRPSTRGSRSTWGRC